MRPSLRSPALAAALLAPLAGCSHGVGHVGHPLPTGPPYYYELEPNDGPLIPDRIGAVDDRTLLYVGGHVEAIGFDIVDHIEFFSVEPAIYDFRLDALSPFGDVDVTIYDPIDNVIVAEYFFAGPVEYGEVVVHLPGRPFQFIIEAYGLDTEWELELAGRPYIGHLRAAGEAADGLDGVFELGGGLGGDLGDERTADAPPRPAIEAFVSSPDDATSR